MKSLLLMFGILLSITIFSVPQMGEIEEIPFFTGVVKSVDLEKGVVVIQIDDIQKKGSFKINKSSKVNYFGRKGDKYVSAAYIKVGKEITIQSEQFFKDYDKGRKVSEKLYDVSYIRVYKSKK